jgi:hypothetical protein
MFEELPAARLRGSCAEVLPLFFVFRQRISGKVSRPLQRIHSALLRLVLQLIHIIVTSASPRPFTPLSQ